MRGKRKVIYVPILHTSADMGSLAGALREAYTKKFGEKKWTEHVRAIVEMWEAIEKKLRGLKLPWERTRIYQDGLPVCGKEREIVRELAQKGSRNHQCVMRLMERGATIEGTEDPRLLLREYKHHKGVAGAKTHTARERYIHEFAKEAGELLKKRDRKIRDRIVGTLKAGETAIVFLGLLHRVDEILPPDIRITYLSNTSVTAYRKRKLFRNSPMGLCRNTAA